MMQTQISVEQNLDHIGQKEIFMFLYEKLLSRSERIR